MQAQYNVGDTIECKHKVYPTRYVGKVTRVYHDVHDGLCYALFVHGKGIINRIVASEYVVHALHQIDHA